MTRRKKTKSAAAVSAPGEFASAVLFQHDNVARGSLESDVTLNNAPTYSYTGYSLLGPRPVYPAPAPRPVSSPAPQPVHITQGLRPVHASLGLRLVYPLSGPRPVSASSGPRPQPRQASRLDDKASSGPLLLKTSVGSRPVTTSCDRSVITRSPTTGSPTQSEVASSVVSVSSTNTSDFKHNKSKKKPKQSFKVKVSYETKQIHIYPRQPILMVERLKDLEHHVGVLTLAVGRRPSVYPHGRGVRFVPETEAEYTMIQRYLARIEAQEKIAWCSYSLPPGNSLKINVKVRVVERIKIEEHLTKLKLGDEKIAKPFETEKKDTVAKDPQSTVTSKQNGTKAAKSTPRDKCVSTSSSVPNNKNNIIKQISTSTSGQLDLKTKENQQAAAKDKLVGVADAVPRQSARRNVNTASTNHSAVKPVPIVSKPKKTTETDKTSTGLKTEQNERNNKLRIVGVVRTNKMF